jgi:IS30 family transposase
MTSGPRLTEWEIDQAKKLYTSGMSWREVGRTLGRCHKTLQRNLGTISRSYSETAKMRWEKLPPGPRMLSKKGKRQYLKLRDLGFDRDAALRAAE